MAGRGRRSLWLMRVLTSGLLFLVAVFVVGRARGAARAGTGAVDCGDLRRRDDRGAARADVLRARRRGRARDRLRSRCSGSAGDRRGLVARRASARARRLLRLPDRRSRRRAARLRRVAAPARRALVPARRAPAGARARRVQLGLRSARRSGSRTATSRTRTPSSSGSGFFGIGVPTLHGICATSSSAAAACSSGRRSASRPPSGSCSCGGGACAPRPRSRLGRRRSSSLVDAGLLPAVRRRLARAALPRRGAAVPRARPRAGARALPAADARARAASRSCTMTRAGAELGRAQRARHGVPSRQERRDGDDLVCRRPESRTSARSLVLACCASRRSRSARGDAMRRARAVRCGGAALFLAQLRARPRRALRRARATATSTLYGAYAHEMADGHWPYRDFYDEYPVARAAALPASCTAARLVRRDLQVDDGAVRRGGGRAADAAARCAARSSPQSWRALRRCSSARSSSTRTTCSRRCS